MVSSRGRVAKYRNRRGKRAASPTRLLRAKGKEVDQQDRYRAALTGNPAYFALFMDQLPGGAWLKDKEGRYVYANRYAAEKIFERPLQDLLGKTDEELLSCAAEP